LASKRSLNLLFRSLHILFILSMRKFYVITFCQVQAHT